MTSVQLIRQSLSFHRRIHFAVACGVATATAILAGALLVGDSVRGSLRHLTLDRLGSIEEVLVVDRFFREALAEELAQQEEVKTHYPHILPAILLSGTVEKPDSQSPTRASQVTLLGTSPRFWELGDGGPTSPLELDEVALNEPLAEELGVEIGEEILVRVPLLTQIPGDSPLGRKTENVQSRRFRVASILPATGLGRFGLRPNQQLPRNAFFHLPDLQQVIDKAGKANALLASTAIDSTTVPSPEERILPQALQPTLEDYGLLVRAGQEGQVQITSERMLFDSRSEQEVFQATKTWQPFTVLTYLANAIEAGGREIPYSTVVAVDFERASQGANFVSIDGAPLTPLEKDQIVLNAWAAEDLGVKPGDSISLKYFPPESTHGEVQEITSPITFRLKAIAAMEGLAADPSWTPEVPGVTDQASIDDWDPPFPFDYARVRGKDEQYWDEYRATPKAFVSLETGRQLWGSRFGQTTAIRFDGTQGLTPETLSGQISLSPQPLGFTFQPVKQQGLQAAAGTTPFNVLFLGFSFFIIAAALMLVVLLFRLGAEQRSSQMGLLAAIGWGPRQVCRLLLTEGLIVAGLGALFGVLAGVGYAWLMLAGLRTWWVDAVSTPFLHLYVTPVSLAGGWLLGVFASILAMRLSLVSLQRLSVRELLRGASRFSSVRSPQGSCLARLAAAVLAILAVAGGFFASRLGGEARTGMFFGSGASLLAAGLLYYWGRLRDSIREILASSSVLPLWRLARQNAARNPLRSLLTVGAVASACFLIIAISAFHLDPTEEGVGGYTLVAESDQPIFANLNSADGRAELSFDRRSEQQMADVRVMPFRLQPGDDASCLNLYQPTQPTLLGVTPAFVEAESDSRFGWGATAASTAAESANPWLLLDQELPPAEDGAPVIPMILDANTAQYSLHLWGGVGDTFEIRDEYGEPLRLQVVGLLKNSIFQGRLLVGEGDLEKYFPSVSGYRFFLARTPTEQTQAVLETLESRLGDYGFDAESAAARLRGFLAVQNTYLQTFQSLGALGLLLGTFGVAAVQLRSIFERRGELALMRAAGFRRRRLATMVLLENLALLGGGLLVGTAAAVLAILPHITSGVAELPWLWFTGTLLAIVLVGLAVGLVAVRAILAVPLLPALRAE